MILQSLHMAISVHISVLFMTEWRFFEALIFCFNNKPFVRTSQLKHIIVSQLKCSKILFSHSCGIAKSKYEITSEILISDEKKVGQFVINLFVNFSAFVDISNIRQLIQIFFKKSFEKTVASFETIQLSEFPFNLHSNGCPL